VARRGGMRMRQSRTRRASGPMPPGYASTAVDPAISKSNAYAATFPSGCQRRWAICLFVASINRVDDGGHRTAMRRLDSHIIARGI